MPQGPLFEKQNPHALLIDKLEENIQQGENALEGLMSSMQESFELLWKMKNQYNDLEMKYSENISPDEEKELLQLKSNIESKQNSLKKDKPQEIIQRIQDVISVRKKELDRLRAQADPVYSPDKDISTQIYTASNPSI